MKTYGFPGKSVPAFLITLLVAFLGTASSVHAQFYAGPKMVAVQYKLVVPYETGNLGLIAGYKFTVGKEGKSGTIAFEGEALFPVTQRDLQELTLLSLYAAYRLPTAFILKARAGMTTELIKVSFPAADFTDNGFSWGVGIGWQYKNGWSFELETTATNADFRHSGLGVYYAF